MTKIWQSLFAVVVAAAVAITGCTTPATNTNTGTNTNANTANSNVAATPANTNRAIANDLTITLPLLDAMFAQEGFSDELKSKLQLNDEQVEKLRGIARDATSKLNEEGERQGTTAAARKQAEEQIRATIGDAKAQQMNAYLAERYNASGAGALPQLLR